MVDVQEEAGVPANQRTTMKLVKVNDAGVAVGCSGYQRAGESCNHTVVYDGVMRTLTTLPDFGFGSGATNISTDSQTVTGMVVDAGHTARAALWRNGQLQTIPVLGGDSEAMNISAGGTVVGHLGTLTGYGAWMYRDNKVTMLDSLVPDSGWHLHDADGFNDREEVVGLGTIDGKDHAYQLNLGPCRVCVTDVQLQDHDLPSRAWHDVGADGTVDGNAVRVRVHVANHDDQSHVFQLKARDETRKQAITDQAPTVSLDPGEEQWVELEWDTDGLAWKDGKPDADHVLRVRAVLGHSIYSGRSVVLKVRPRPVVLVPGALEDASVWKAYADLLKRTNPEWEAHAVTGLDTGRWADLGHAPDTLDRHSEVLQSFVAGVRDEEDAEHVDLVAHGLGWRDRAAVDPGRHARRRRAAPDPARHAQHRLTVRGGRRRRPVLRPAARRDGRLQRPRDRASRRRVLRVRRRRRRLHVRPGQRARRHGGAALERALEHRGR